ncbi:hypothetical protein [Pseudomonas sp. TH31]|uniref:hypothetical protein n=1 Tax=Pseudomonas sp. TH31 TaxID=2796396 RepID=UPI00191441F8|nr:hypothetical protein [Pseudomonas sp. TH31]MBK5417731.1 hypothetical protein [Pseudomonas sp. TH31]
MSEVTATKDRTGEVLPIVRPGKSIGKSALSGTQTFTSTAPDGEAIYIFCTSLIHVAEGATVTDTDAPIDARGGVYLNANRGRSISVKLLAGEDPAVVWIHEVR